MEDKKSLFNELYQSKNFFLLAGPCVVESKEITEEIAQSLIAITNELGIKLVFKASYLKANRSSVDSFSTIGVDKSLQILADIKNKFNIPIVTDIHTEAEAAIAAQVADVLQIPAFLCRQTSLLVAAGQTGKIINIKKGQFLSPQAMSHAARKVVSTNNAQVMLTERGTTFGYQDLIVDYRSIPIMKQLRYPVILDCTHALQQPNQLEGVTGGQPQWIETIAMCGIAAGVDGLFIETHPNPTKALSDGANMLPLNEIKPLLTKLTKLKAVVSDL